MSAPIELRIAIAALTAACATVLLGPWTIRMLRVQGALQPIRPNGPAHHCRKAGTVTMGGLLILSSASGATAASADLHSRALWIAWLATTGFAAVGFADDYAKVRGRSSRGLTPRAKGWPQLVVAALVVVAVGALNARPGTAFVWWVPLLAFVAIVGFANAVNLSDGIDGLAPALVAIAAAAIGWVIYASTAVPHEGAAPLSGDTRELAIYCAAISGASLGFLKFNWHPARIFMGDVGSLALGAGLTTAAMTAGAGVVSLIIMGVFLVEWLSSATQVVWVKLTGRRLLRMAPLHHHLELIGWSEPRIVRSFAVAAALLALAGMLAGR